MSVLWDLYCSDCNVVLTIGKYYCMTENEMKAFIYFMTTHDGHKLYFLNDVNPMYEDLWERINFGEPLEKGWQHDVKTKAKQITLKELVEEYKDIFPELFENE